MAQVAAKDAWKNAIHTAQSRAHAAERQCATRLKEKKTKLSPVTDDTATDWPQRGDTLLNSDHSLRTRVEGKITEARNSAVGIFVGGRNSDLHEIGYSRGLIHAYTAVLDLIQESVQEMNDDARS